MEAPGGIRLVPGAAGIRDFIHFTGIQQQLMLIGLQQLERRFDYLIIDTAAGLSEPLLQFLLAAPYTVITITQEPTSLTEAFSLLKVLKQRAFTGCIFVVVNLAADSPSARDAFSRFKGATAKYLQLEVHCLGFILADNRVPKSVCTQQLFFLQYPHGPASRCLKAVGQRLVRMVEGASIPEAGFTDCF